MTKAQKYLTKAKNEHFAIGAFNVSNIETLKAVTNAAKNLKAPIIVEASAGEVRFVGMTQLVKLVRVYEEELNIPIILNLDHGADFDTCKKAIEAGFDYVHLDGSKFPLDQNIRETQRIVELARARSVIVEGEIDHIEGSSADHTKESPDTYQKASSYTDPQKAKDFVEKTGVDVFASFVGNVHGLYAKNKHLQMGLLKEIQTQIPDTYLSLHGGSGIQSQDIKNAIAAGIQKINVNTELRIAFKMTLQETLNSTNEIAVYKLMQKPILAVQNVVEGKIRLFGSENEL